MRICRRSCGAMWPEWRRSFRLHLPQPKSGLPDFGHLIQWPNPRYSEVRLGGGGDAATSEVPRMLHGRHPTPDRLRRSDPPPAGEGEEHTRLMFMMSSGGLTAADLFQGKDAILSGPAGGVVGMAQTGREAGFADLIGFDMGGTSN